MCTHVNVRTYHVSASTVALPAGNDYAMLLLGGLDLHLYCVQLIQPIRDAWNINCFRIAGVIIELKEPSGKLRGKGYSIGKREILFLLSQSLSQQCVCVCTRTALLLWCTFN
jgi:hypothetical protein